MAETGPMVAIAFKVPPDAYERLERLASAKQLNVNLYAKRVVLRHDRRMMRKEEEVPA